MKADVACCLLFALPKIRRPIRNDGLMIKTYRWQVTPLALFNAMGILILSGCIPNDNQNIDTGKLSPKDLPAKIESPSKSEVLGLPSSWYSGTVVRWAVFPANRGEKVQFTESTYIDTSVFDITPRVKEVISASNKPVYVRLASDSSIEEINWATNANLTGLSLAGLEITERQLQNLEGSNKLVWLSCVYSKFERDALLPELKKLKFLFLGGNDHLCKSQDFGKFPELESLYLSGASFDDHDLARLSKSNAGLKYLSLFECPITENSIEVLKRFTKLKYLNVGLTELRMKNFQDILPGCHVEQGD